MKYSSLLLAIFAYVFCSSAHGQTYTLTDLGATLASNSNVTINNSGHIALTTTVNGHAQPAIWFGGVLQPITGFGSDGHAADINDSNMVVGSFTDGSGGFDAFLYDGTTHNLGTLGGFASEARAINASGEIVGFSYAASTEQHAFYYSGGVMNDGGTLGGMASFARALNNNGLVVGNSLTSNNDSAGFSLQTPNGSMVNLGLGADAYSVNLNGQIVGVSNGVAFLYQGGVLTSLGTLPGGSTSKAESINSSGDIVGISGSSNGNHAFVEKNGTMLDLNGRTPSFNGLIMDAMDINDSGQIVASGFTSKGQSTVFLLTPVVPEPTSAALIGGCGLLILLMRRRPG